MSLATILKPELADFAKLLLAAGFRVYVFKSDVERVAKGGLESHASHFAFSRVVADRLCWASVSQEISSYHFSMPIKPSHKHGSSMFIGGDRMPDAEPLSIANAELYASPTGHNHLVGTQENYAEGFAHLYQEMTA